MNAAPLPLVTVTIPTYRSARTIAETVESVLAQTYPNLEVVVVDDGSPDDTLEVLRRFEGRIEVIAKPNGGLATARNRGVEAARGEYVAFLDADDLCMPRRIELQVAAMRQFPAAVLCSTDFSAFNAAGRVSDSHEGHYYSRIAEAPDGIASLFPRTVRLEGVPDAGSVDCHVGEAYRELAFGNFVHPPTMLFRRAAFDRAGPLDPAFRVSCDWEWTVRMAKLGPFVHLATPLLDYRLSSTQLSSGAGNRGRGVSESVAIARRIWEADPALAAAEPRRMRRHRATLYGDAAYVLSEFSARESLAMLGRALLEGASPRFAARVAARILLPRPVLDVVRRRRAT